MAASLTCWLNRLKLDIVWSANACCKEPSIANIILFITKLCNMSQYKVLHIQLYSCLDPSWTSPKVDNLWTNHHFLKTTCHNVNVIQIRVLEVNASFLDKHQIIHWTFIETDVTISLGIQVLSTLSNRTSTLGIKWHFFSFSVYELYGLPSDCD